MILKSINLILKNFLTFPAFQSDKRINMRYFFVVYILFSSLILSQVPDSSIQNSLRFAVDSIAIEGNDITEEFIILRELTFGVNDSVDTGILAYNRERIFSLGLFNYVEMQAGFLGSKSIVKIIVRETWYIYPIPFVKLENNSFDKAAYGINFLWRNFRGRDETVRALISFGYDPTYGVSYYNPALSDSKEYNFAFGIVKQKMANKSNQAAYLFGSDFDYNIFYGDVTFGKRLNQFNEFLIFAGFDYVESPDKYIKGITASNSRIDRSVLAGFNYIYDTRDLKQFSRNGIYTSLRYTHKGFGIKNIDFNILHVDFREYRPVIDDLAARWRLEYRHTFGRLVPYYDRSFFGFTDIIRGHRTDEREGHNLILSSLELSYPIIKEWHLSFSLPPLPKQLTSARIGFFISLFGDTGLTYDNGEPITLKKLDSGWGIGLTMLILPYNAFRIEYAFDEEMNGEFLFGTGFSF